MKERDFCFWLWGFMELNYTDSPTVDQWKCIKAHLATVFDKKAPDVNDMKNDKTKVVPQWPNNSDFDLKKAIEKYNEQRKAAGQWPFDQPIKITC